MFKFCQGKEMLIQGNALTELKKLGSESIDCCITSPPYYALRDYKVEGQLGLEKTFQEYLDNLIQIFIQVKRVLKKTGTCWVVMGDTYAGSGHGQKDTGKHGYDPSVMATMKDKPKNEGYPSKSLLMIPSRFAIQMIDNGWILRNDIIWYKPNCMPSSAKDRFTVDYEHIFFFTKDKKYYFKTQYEEYSEGSRDYIKRSITERFPFGKKGIESYQESRYIEPNHLGRIKRTVWKIPPKPFPEAHFAVFPEELVRQCLDAGCPSEICVKCGTAKTIRYKLGKVTSTGGGKKGAQGRIQMGRHDYPEEGMAAHEHIFDGYDSCNCNAGFKQGTVLDPFSGAGTTYKVALEMDRKPIGIELNPEYIEITKKRISPLLQQEKITSHTN